MRITRLAAAAVIGMAVGLLLAASPARADDGHYPAAGWLLRDIGLGETDWRPGGAAESTIVTATTVELSKPDGATGTSVETTDLGLAVTAGTVISVDYEVVDGVDVFAAGAVRLFYYASADADTLAMAPTAVAVADGSGTLSLAVLADGTVGTLGLTYDASNASAGTVRFSNLMVGDREVLFVRPAPEPTEPSPSPDPEPGQPEPAATPVAAGGNELPTTGSGWVLPAVGVGGAALVAGLALVAALRRKTPTFTAE